MDFLKIFLNRYQKRVKNIEQKLNCISYDPFGMEPEFVAKAISLFEPLYRYYFRVTTHGIENIPSTGRVMLVSNHSGQIPIDALMIGVSIFLEKNPPRVVRSMVDRWVSKIPVLNSIYVKSGQIVGTKYNAKQLLEKENALLVFPEGVNGISKIYKNRYKLKKFGTGFMNLAISTNTPIIPIAVIGAEEQIITIANLKKVFPFLKLPAFPLPAIPFILPTKYHIYFGEPITFNKNSDSSEQNVDTAVLKVKNSISSMLENGLSERNNIFW